MINYEYTNFQDLKEITDKDEPLFFDTETKGLYGKICLAQYYQATDKFTKDNKPCMKFVKFPNLMEMIMFMADKHIVMQNASYDISTIQIQSKMKYVPKKFDDTLLMARLHYWSSPDFGLDHLSCLAFDRDIYRAAGIDKSENQKSDWDQEFITKDQEMYAALDVYALWKIYNECIEVKEDFLYKLDMLSLSYSFEFQTNGFPVQEHQLDKHWQAAETEIQTLAVPINCNSPIQSREYLGTADSAALTILKEINNGNQRAKSLLLTRQAMKRQSFLKKFTTDDNLVHGLFGPYARSGRFTCKNQNLQQLPRKLKGVFGAKNGEVLLYSDFAQVELRAICSIVDEPEMTALFKNGEDLHMYTARMIFGEDATKEQRQATKTANFGLLYGAGVETFRNILIKQADLFMTEGEVRKLVTQWKNLWYTIAAWQQAGVRKWKAGRHTETPLGRKATARMLTDFLNIEVQGFAAEIAKLAMHYMLTGLKEEGLDKDVKLVNFIHDSYIFTAPQDDDIIKRSSVIIADAMQKAWFECTKYAKVSDIPMPVDVYCGSNWGDIENDIYDSKYSLKGMEHYDAD